MCCRSGQSSDCRSTQANGSGQQGPRIKYQLREVIEDGSDEFLSVLQTKPLTAAFVLHCRRLTWYCTGAIVDVGTDGQGGAGTGVNLPHGLSFLRTRPGALEVIGIIYNHLPDWVPTMFRNQTTQLGINLCLHSIETRTWTCIRLTRDMNRWQLLSAIPGPEMAFEDVAS